MRGNPRSRLASTVLGTLLVVLGLAPSLEAQERDLLQDRYVAIERRIGGGALAEAMRELRALIAERPEFHRSYPTLVAAYISTDGAAEARTYFDQLVARDPRNAYAHYALARIDMESGRYEDAIEKLERSMVLDPAFVPAYGLNSGLVEAYMARDELDEAVRFFAARIERDSTDAYAHFGLGYAYRHTSEWGKAVPTLQRAVALAPDLAEAYRALMAIYIRTGASQEVLAIGPTLLEITRRRQDLATMATALELMGGAHLRMGDYGTALRYLHNALASAREVGAREQERETLNDVAVVHGTLGNHERALEYFRAVLELAREADDATVEMASLNNIGKSYEHLGQLQLSKDYFERALSMARTQGEASLLPLFYGNVAERLADLGDTTRALQYQSESLRLAASFGNGMQEGDVSIYRGAIEEARHNPHLAEQYYRRAVELGQEIEFGELVWRGYERLGSMYQKLDRPDDAIQYYTLAIEMYDSLMANVGITSLGVTYLENKYGAYHGVAQLLARDGRHEEAFAYAEKAKAKVLRDMLSQGRYALQGLLPDSLTRRLEEIEAEIEATHRELSVVTAQLPRAERRIVALDQQVTSLELQQAEIVDGARDTYAAYYQLTAPTALSVDDLQSTVLGPDQALVEYVVGLERLSIFVVTQSRLDYREVPIGEEELRGMLTALSPIFGRDGTSQDAEREVVLSPQLADFSVPPAHALYRTLIEPVETLLEESTDLIVVPDGFLSYLPFEALVADTAGLTGPYDFENVSFLVERYAVSYAASASVLDPRLQRPRNATRSLLALGNPEFVELAGDDELSISMEASLGYLGGVVRAGSFVPLPHAESEVRAIAREVGGRDRTYVGSRASEDAFRREAADYRVLHLATHFVADDRQPLYSKLVLAGGGGGASDGLLQTFEVFGMNLNADLVVLSACNTALGKLSRGEGIYGISRAFQYAGVPSLVVSLWSVDDEATSLLMRGFYEHLTAGLTRGRALQQAKLEYLGSQPGKRDPFFWAPFVLIGDWSAVELPPQPPMSRRAVLLTLMATLAMVLSAGILLRRRRRPRAA